MAVAHATNATKEGSVISMGLVQSSIAEIKLVRLQSGDQICRSSSCLRPYEVLVVAIIACRLIFIATGSSDVDV